MNVSTYLSVFALVVIISIVISAIATRQIIQSELKKKIRYDISIIEMVEREKEISEFLKANNLNADGAIDKIAEALKIKMGGVSDNISGRAFLSDRDINGFMTVTHSIRVPTAERLFDFAHECGHIVNGDFAPVNRPEGYNKSKVEQLADYTGAALLMPRLEVLKFLDQEKYETLSNRKRAMVIKKLSKKYKVNEIITIRRINEVLALKKVNI